MNEKPQIRKWAQMSNASFWIGPLIYVIFYLLSRWWWILTTISVVFLFLIWKAFGTGILFYTCLIFIVAMLLPPRGWKGVTRCGLQRNIGLSGLVLWLSLCLAIALPSKAAGWLWCLAVFSLVSIIDNWLRLTRLLSRDIGKLEDEIKDLKSRTAILEQGGYWDEIHPVEAAARELETATNYDSAIYIFQQYPRPILSDAWNKLTDEQKAKVRKWTSRYLSEKGEFWN